MRTDESVNSTYVGRAQTGASFTHAAPVPNDQQQLADQQRVFIKSVSEIIDRMRKTSLSQKGFTIQR